MKSWLQAPTFSPKGFVVRAIFIATVYGFLSLLGFRNYTSVLSLTFPEGSSRGWALFAGMIYLATYFLWILMVPILILGAALMEGGARAGLWARKTPTGRLD